MVAVEGCYCWNAGQANLGVMKVFLEMGHPDMANLVLAQGQDVGNNFVAPSTSSDPSSP